MKRSFLTAAMLALAAPALAQDLPTDDLREAKNAAQRAERACDRGQAAKCLTDARAAEAWIDKALAVLDPAPTPEPTPTPVPTPTPAPEPTPTPTPALSGVLSEGDSLSVFWGGNHTGIYARNNPTVTFHGKAVGGSGIAGLEQRFAADAALKPAVVTVFIGANDLSRWNATTADPFLTDLWAYVGKWKATGAKVLVGTVLGQCVQTQPANNVKHNALRAVANPAIRAAVGTKIDGVIDFAADPVMGTDAAACDKALFPDGLHPSDSTQGVGEGGQAKLARVYEPAVNAALSGAPVPEAPHHETPPAFEPLTVADIAPIEQFPLAGNVGTKAIPPSAIPDVVGAARMLCNFSHLSYDDPIAYPKQPGKAHLHDFFGNTLTDANSTYETLRATGQSTCHGDILNRSAYWIPALLDGKGNVVRADWVVLYYKRRPDGDPKCATEARECGGIPAGLRAIFGTNYTLGHLQSPNVAFDCATNESKTQSLAETVRRCAGQPHIYARIHAPDCWDGVNLDSPDHQSHLAYRTRDQHTGQPLCPATHPVIIPQLTLTVAYAILEGDDPTLWAFSSDVMAGAAPGTTFHADYMEAWEPAARLTWEAHCIGKLLNCSDGDLGNGTILRRPEGFTFAQRPHLVPVPANDNTLTEWKVAQ